MDSMLAYKEYRHCTHRDERVPDVAAGQTHGGATIYHGCGVGNSDLHPLSPRCTPVIATCVRHAHLAPSSLSRAVASLHSSDWSLDHGVGTVVVRGEMVNRKVCCWCGRCEKGLGLHQKRRINHKERRPWPEVFGPRV
ncbi:uncharacterized protein [Physcomitrium patens]|uniref:uncharacterized protein n=1 Tax=Physcomitrium patens TaxID=3218 RepID=UPI003CCE3FFD